MKIAFCAYRDWALRVGWSVKEHPRVTGFTSCWTNQDLEEVLNSAGHNLDLVLFCGWSTAPSESLVARANALNVLLVSEHPAADDRYSPGTPLQNQILDGITCTKHRIVMVGFPELAPRQWSHEVDMELSGNMNDILEQMTATSKVLFTRFLDDYPHHIVWNTWPEVSPDKQVPRRTPDMSKLPLNLGTMTTRDLYDRIRCLEDPYPNAYVEDDEGIIYFNRVSYKAKR